MITDAILGLDHIEYERLHDIKVDEVMLQPVPSIHVSEKFKRGLDLLINNPFLCVIDDEETFVGILTRRVVLKQLKKHIYQNNQ